MHPESEHHALPHVLDARRREFQDSNTGLISFYSAAPAEGPDPEGSGPPPRPMLLIHSVNAAASAHEVRPLFEHFSRGRPVYALDLPGYGFSDRSDRAYLPRLMVDAIHAMIARIRSEFGQQPVDALAVSLSSEFLARAACEQPEAFRSLALVSSTGFRRRTASGGQPGGNRGRPAVLRSLQLPVVGKALYNTLTTAPSIRFFLQKTWGSKQIDEQMFRDSYRMTRHPGARHAPFYFLSGFLFSSDIREVLDALTHPVWLSHGVRGDFTDFSRAEEYAGEPNWRISVFQTGALPYFEVPDAFCSAYEDFLDAAGGDGAVNPAIDR